MLNHMLKLLERILDGRMKAIGYKGKSVKNSWSLDKNNGWDVSPEIVSREKTGRTAGYDN